jgi:D-galactose 1-dehydrogenase
VTKQKIGIIGFGKIARDQHAPAIAASPDFELVGVSNLGTGTAPEGVQGFATYAEMLRALPDMAAVAICTPPGPRRSIAADCLTAGRHVLLEKPPAATVTEVRDIAERAQQAGKVAYASYHAQHNMAVKAAAKALAGKSVTTLVVTWKEDLRRWHPGQDWIMAAGGFGIFDPGINALSILTRILPVPIFISKAMLSFPANRQAPIAASLAFATGQVDGEKLSAEFDWRQTGPQTWEIDVKTTDGFKLKLLDGGAQLQIDGQPPLIGAADEYSDIYREFAALLAAGNSDVGAEPFQLVADAFMLAERQQVDAFEF